MDFHEIITQFSELIVGIVSYLAGMLTKKLTDKFKN